MGKYSMTKSRNARAVKTRDLYGSSSVSDNDWNAIRYLLGDVGAFGFYPFKMYDEFNYMNDYLKNRGLSWSDMKYPSLAPKSSAGFHWNVSTKALKRLYR